MKYVSSSTNNRTSVHMISSSRARERADVNRKTLADVNRKEASRREKI